MEDMEMFEQSFEDGYGQLFDQCVITDHAAGDEESSAGSNFYGDVKPFGVCESFNGDVDAARSQFGFGMAPARHPAPWAIPSSHPSGAVAAQVSPSMSQGYKAKFYQEASGRASFSDSELLSNHGASQIKSRSSPHSSEIPQHPSSQTVSPFRPTAPESLRLRASDINLRAQYLRQTPTMMHNPLHMRSDSSPALFRDWDADLDLTSSRFAAAGISQDMPLSPPSSAKLYGTDQRFATSHSANASFEDFTYARDTQHHQGYSVPSQSQLTPLPSPGTGTHRSSKSSSKQHQASKSEGDFAFSSRVMGDNAQHMTPQTPSQGFNPWIAGADNDTLNFTLVGGSPEFGGADQAQSWWATGAQATGASQPGVPRSFAHGNVQEATRSLMEMTGLMTGGEYGACDDGADSTSNSLASQGLMISCEPRDVAVFDDQDSDMMIENHPGHDFFNSSSPSSQNFSLHRALSAGSNGGMSAERESLRMTPSSNPSSRPRPQNPLQHSRRPSHHDQSRLHSRNPSFVHSPTSSPTMRSSKPRQASRCRKASSRSNMKATEATNVAAIAAATSQNSQALSSSPSSSTQNRKAHPRSTSTSSTSSNSSSTSSHNNQPQTPSSPLGFVNFTPSDRRKILTGVAPSGSSKTKARREKEARDKNRKLEMAAMKAVRAAGGDIGILTSESAEDFLG
ncbi:MAG: hypothetical protein M4579_005199 [Chaenotheca gracillima]|nr:MAG: hypothetical protein M4579_005199 [Chaenotheca gracillima]